MFINPCWLFLFVDIFSCLFLVTFAASKNQNKPSEGRIVGGHVTDITEVPYQVSVQYINVHICGGSIIGARYILTAAHCFKKRFPSLFSIRAGSNYHYKGGQVIKVAKVICHPSYSPKFSFYDAAILILENHLTSGEGVEIATLANVEPKPGDMALISGWGSMEEGKGSSDLLQSVVVPVIHRAVCRRMYPWEDITEQMFCAGYLRGGKDSCEGDSGGPVVIDKKLAGIVSWAYGCARNNYPGVNTNVVKILSWITSIILK